MMMLVDIVDADRPISQEPDHNDRSKKKPNLARPESLHAEEQH